MLTQPSRHPSIVALELSCNEALELLLGDNVILTAALRCILIGQAVSL